MKPTPAELLGLRICELRTRLGWTQQDLAAELGIAVQGVARWEQGRVEMRIGSIYRVSEALGLRSPTELLKKPRIKPRKPGRPRG